VPAGLWAAHEYEKLPDYDNPIYAQPTQPFGCHQQDGRLCAGWVACHTAQHDGHVMALRLLTRSGFLPLRVETYTTDVPVFASGMEAALHGISGIENPSAEARKAIDKLLRAEAKRRAAQVRG